MIAGGRIIRTIVKRQKAQIICREYRASQLQNLFSQNPKIQTVAPFVGNVKQATCQM